MPELYDVRRSEERRIATRGSLQIFAEFYFPARLSDDVPKYHIELYDKFLPGRKTPRIMRMLDIEPRAHGKSVRWSIIYPLWLLCTNPYNLKRKVDLICLSNTATKAEDFLREIGVELETNVRLMADWGQLLKGSKVNNTMDKILANGARIRARGMGAQIRGDHPSDILIDDLEDRVESQNPKIREDTEKYFRQDLFGALDPDTSMIMVGTIVHEEGLLNTLWKDDEMTEGWTKLKYSAITDDGKALWPSRWSLERLEQRRKEVGELAFSQEYLNLPLPSENPTIRPEWIQWYTKLPIHIRDFDYKIVAVDAAFSQKRTADFTAIGALGLISNGEHAKEVYVLDAMREHYSPKEVVNKTVDTAVKFKARAIVIEAVSGSMIYIDLLREELHRRHIYDCEIWGVTPHESKQRKGEKMDKLSRLQSTAHLYQQELIHFPKHLQWIVSEILLMPFGSHDDGADMITWGLRELDRREIRRIGKRRTKPTQSYSLTGTGGY